MSLQLVNHSDFLDALAGAHDVALAAYCLGPPMRDALVCAAGHGAHVEVTLDGAFPFDRSGTRAARNKRLAADLASHGVSARVADAGEPTHTKAAVIDGVAWLDDRNFPKTDPDMLVRDDEPADVAAIANRIAGGEAACARVTFTKGESLALEADLLRQAPGEIDVSCENFGYGTIYGILKRQAQTHHAVHLLVDAREAHAPTTRAALVHLAEAGADVRVRHGADKVALTGQRAWIGSANPTHPSPGQSDWGLVTDRVPALHELQTRFDKAWSEAKTLDSIVA